MISDQQLNIQKIALSAFNASIISQIVHPFDVIKTRLQSHDGQANKNLVPRYSGMVDAFKSIYRIEGIRGLTKGIFVSLFANAFANTCFFVMYKKFQTSAMNNLSQASKDPSSINASVLATLITQPLWVIKTRILLNVNPHCHGLANTIQASREVFQQHGFKGYYRGTSMSLFLCSHGAVQMNFYEAFMQTIDGVNIYVKPFICGVLSKIGAIYVTYPLTTIRTRFQQNQFIDSLSPKYGSILDVVIKTYKFEGLSGFYKGALASVIRGLPSRGFFFFFYELLKKN